MRSAACRRAPMRCGSRPSTARWGDSRSPPPTSASASKRRRWPTSTPSGGTRPKARPIRRTPSSPLRSRRGPRSPASTWSRTSMRRGPPWHRSHPPTTRSTSTSTKRSWWTSTSASTPGRCRGTYSCTSPAQATRAWAEAASSSSTGEGSCSLPRRRSSSVLRTSWRSPPGSPTGPATRSRRR